MSNDFEDVAQMIRYGLKDRLDRQEEDRTGGESVNIYRFARDTLQLSDTVSTTTDSAASWTWGQSEWDFDEWG